MRLYTKEPSKDPLPPKAKKRDSMAVGASHRSS